MIKEETKKRLQRPPAEQLYAGQLEKLKKSDKAPKPPGWQLSPQAVRTFILGDKNLDIEPKFVGDPAMVERAMVSIATNRGLLLIGEPGTAKSLLSELLTAAISNQSTLTIQGGAATTEDQIKYSWNYAMLVSDGPSLKSLVPGPLYKGMKEGRLVRFEEITRCPPEVQDCLLSVLSDRVMAIGELEGEDGMLFAREGFNIIATANTRDRGVNEMSAALKRRFNFETVFPIPDFKTESELIKRESDRLLDESGIPYKLGEDLLELLVTTFRELRTGETMEGQKMEQLSTIMSTAEAVSVAFSVGVRSFYLRESQGIPADIVECLAGVAAKDNKDDLKRLRRYFEQVVSKRKGEHWRAYFDARHLLVD